MYISSFIKTITMSHKLEVQSWCQYNKDYVNSDVVEA